MFASRIPATKVGLIATVLVSHLPDEVALLVAALDSLARFPPRWLEAPGLVALLPMSGRLAVVRPRPFPYAAVPDLSVAIPCPVTGHPDMAGHGHGYIRKDAYRRRRPDGDGERSIAGAEANVGVVRE